MIRSLWKAGKSSFFALLILRKVYSYSLRLMDIHFDSSFVVENENLSPRNFLLGVGISMLGKTGVLMITFLFLFHMTRAVFLSESILVMKPFF